MKAKKPPLHQAQGTVQVALCINDAWAIHVETLVYSLSCHHKEEGATVHIVYRELSEANLKRIRLLSEVLPQICLRFYQVTDTALLGISVENYNLPIESYFRFALPELLKDVDRVLYLDTDMLVCGNLASLWELDMEGHCLAVVNEEEVKIFFRHILQNLNFSDQDLYFNSGFLLMDLQKMREQQHGPALVKLALEKSQEFELGDQDVLNVYFKNKLTELDRVYNYTWFPMVQYNQPLDQVKVLHFNGPYKPWKPIIGYGDIYVSYAMVYQQYRRAYQRLIQSHQQLLTVVVLVDNEHFLQDALTSLTNQTYTNLEILLVNRTNNSYVRTLLKKWTSYDERVSLLDVGSLSLHSLLPMISSMSKGDYLFFLQSSDYVEVGMVEASLSLLSEKTADIVLVEYCTLNCENGIYRFPNVVPEHCQELSREDLLTTDKADRFSLLWGQWYRRELLESLYISEDVSSSFISHQAYGSSQKTLFLRGNYFCHRQLLPDAVPEVRDYDYYSAAMRELDLRLADMVLQQLDSSHLLGQMKVLIEEALETCEQEHPNFAIYLREKLQHINQKI